MNPTTNPPIAGMDFSADAPRSDLRNPATWGRAYLLLEELGREFPSLRLGQLICALAAKARTTAPGSVYDLEDDELVAAAEEWLTWRRANR